MTETSIIIPDSVKERLERSDERLRAIALEYAAKLGTTVHSDVLNAANAYYAFLKGEANEERLKTDEIQE